MAGERIVSRDPAEIPIPGYQIQFGEDPQLTSVRFYGIPRTYLMGKISNRGTVNSVYFPIIAGREEFSKGQLRNATFIVDHVVVFPLSSQFQMLVDVRTREEALDSKGLEERNPKDPSTLSLAAGVTLIPTLSQIEQANHIFLLEQAITNTSPEMSATLKSNESHSELSLLGPITYDLVDPFKYAGLNIGAVFNSHTIYTRYEEIISQLRVALANFPEKSFERKRSEVALDHAKRSYLFASQLYKLSLNETQRITQILSMTPQELLEQRNLMALQEAQARNLQAQHLGK